MGKWCNSYAQTAMSAQEKRHHPQFCPKCDSWASGPQQFDAVIFNDFALK